jgi:hypothetical protein
VRGELTPQQFQRLIEAVVAKIQTNEASIRAAEGEITVRIFRHGDGIDVKLTTTR